MNRASYKIKKLYAKYKPEFYGFLIPFLIESVVVLIAYAICRYGISSCDCFAQYMPFFTELYDKVTSGESLFFSWSGAMGYDFWSVFAYYLASPLNWIIFIFGRKGIAFSVNLLIILKTSLCGATFTHFLRVKYGRGGVKLPALFGTMFALSGYTLGYCFNVMWFDSIILFPLVLLALDRMLYEKKPARYCLLLACSLIFNYFIGFMTCIFIFLYFFTCNFSGVKDFFAKLFRIAVSSIIAVGAAAVILLPSYMILRSTSISSETMPGFELMGNWGDTLYNILFATNPVAISWTSNRANMFISGFGLFTAFLYLVSRKFPLRDKLKYVFLIGFMYLSFNCEVLNYIWHGFHMQNGIPNRFSFMVIFLLLTMGYQAARKRRSIKTRELVTAAVLHAAFIGLIYYLRRSVLEECFITLMIMLLYLVICLHFRSGRRIAKYAGAAVMAELTAMFIIAVFNVTGMSLDGYFHYVDDMLAAEEQTHAETDGFFREKLDQSNNLKEFIVNDDYDYIGADDMTWPLMLEMIDNIRNIGHHTVLNEESLYGMNAGSLFNTFTNSNMSDFIKRTGGSGSSNTILYRGENAFMDMLLGYRYYYARYHTARSAAYEYFGSAGEVDIYENLYPLSVGYSIPYTFADLESYYQSNPFSTMNEMSSAICHQDIYTHETLEYTGCVNATMEDASATYAEFTDVAFKGTATFEYTADRDQNFQIYLVCGDMYLTEIRINGELIASDRQNRQIMDLGALKAGDHVEVTIIMKQKSELTMNIYGASMNTAILDRCYNILSREQLDVTYYDDNTIEGSVTIADDDTDFLLTVPYSSGWSVSVDGTELDTDDIGIFSDTFIMLTLDAGEHEIALNYVTPGFAAGAICSAVCFIIIGLTAFLTARRTPSRGRSDRRRSRRTYGEYDAISSLPHMTDDLTPQPTAGYDSPTGSSTVPVSQARMRSALSTQVWEYSSLPSSARADEAQRPSGISCFPGNGPIDGSESFPDAKSDKTGGGQSSETPGIIDSEEKF